MSVDLKAMFPRASADFIEANKGGDASLPSAPVTNPDQSLTRSVPCTGSTAAPTFKPKGRQMTKTEREYGLVLESLKRKGVIDDYEYEGLTLKWGGLRYTPDFVVTKTIPIECESCGKTHTRLQSYVRLIEVKGGYIWEDSIVKFKAARARWPTFQFECHQKKDGSWKRIL